MGKCDVDIRRAIGVSVEMLLALHGIADEVGAKGGSPESIRLIECEHLRGRFADLIIEMQTEEDKKAVAEAARQAAKEAKKMTASTFKAEIDTDKDPRLPFSGASIEKHARQGKVTIEKRPDGLYLDGRKVVLYRSLKQVNGKTVVGHELKKELDGKPVLSVSILDFLSENQEYIPEEWKKDENGNTIFIFFWGTIYRHAGGRLYVRDLYWNGNRWYWNCYWLDRDWYFHDPAALLAS
ncbi:MAG: hypothetical protein AAB358_00745 [Patescibacteria group bacterium]